MSVCFQSMSKLRVFIGTETKMYRLLLPSVTGSKK